MVKTCIGKISGRGKSIAVVVSRFNEVITRRLLDACVDELLVQGVSQKNITVLWVPGAFEIPLISQLLAKKKTIDAVICLGAIIRGETFHYELIAQGTMQGICQASMTTGKPVIFEVLATETIEDANSRSKSKGINKGRDAALTALEMVSIVSQIK